MDEYTPIPQNPTPNTPEPDAPAPMSPQSAVQTLPVPPQGAIPPQQPAAPPPPYYPPAGAPQQSPYGQSYPQQGMPPQQPYPPQPGMPYPPYGQPVVPVAPVQPSKFSLMIASFWALVQKTLKTPATALSEFAASGDTGHAYILTGLKALCAALLMMVVALRLNASIDNTLGMYSRYIRIAFPAFPIFLITLLGAAGFVFLLAAILLFVGKVVLKQPATYSTMLRVAAGKSMADIPFCLVGILAALINPVLGLGVMLLGAVLSIFFLLYAFKGAFPAVSADKRLYSLFLSLVVLMIASAIFLRIVSPLCLPNLGNLF